MDLVVRDVRLWEHGRIRRVDLAVDGGRIAAIGTDLAYSGPEIDAGGKLGWPGSSTPTSTSTSLVFSPMGRRQADSTRPSRAPRRRKPDSRSPTFASAPPRITGACGYGFTIGSPADLVVLDSTAPALAVAQLADVWGMKAGVRTFTRDPAVIHHPERTGQERSLT